MPRAKKTTPKKKPAAKKKSGDTVRSAPAGELTRVTVPASGLRIGAHMSIAGGVHKSLERGQELGCPVIQLFTKSNSQWAARPLTDADVDAWFGTRERTGVEPAMAHDSYLINLASPDDALFEKSIAAFAHEIERCALLEVPLLVMHPGSHLGTGEAAGLARVADGLAQALERAMEAEATIAVRTGRVPFHPTVLIETTAGQGTNLGYRFEHLRDLLGDLAHVDRYGVCLDTCHVFAAGYDIRDEDGWAMMMEEFDAVVGVRHLRALHLNDSKKPCGSRVDRHANIGAGEIGRGAFAALLRDPRVNRLPMALETPKVDDGDRRNLALLHRLAE